MTKVHVRGTIRRVGNSLALLLPAQDARRASLRPGQIVEADIESEPESILGLLADLPYEPFRRSDENHDRV